MDRVEELLISWGLTRLVAAFQAQDITEDILLNSDILNGELLKELIPSVGLRATFLDKRDQYKRANLETCVASENVIKETPTSLVSSQSQPPASAAAAAAAASATLSSSAAPSAATSKSASAAPSAAASKSASAASGSSSTPTLIPASRPVKKTVDTFSISNFISLLDIESVLNEHKSAHCALIYLTEKGVLSNTLRTGIVDALVAALLRETRKRDSTDSVNNNHFSQLADRIVDYFPGEKKETYFVPPTKGSISHGKLPVKWRNEKRHQKKHDTTTSTSSLTTIEDPYERILCAQQGPEVDVEAAINFLAFTRNPWPDVERMWKLTFPHRLQKLRDQTSYPFLKQYFDEWPVLSTPTGYTLLESDFSQLYQNHDLTIFAKWPLLESKIKTIAESDVKEKYGQTLVGYLQQDVSPDTRAALTLMLLPAIFPPHHRVGTHKPSIAEARASMILHVKAPAEIRAALTEHQAILKKQGLRVQPLLVVVAPSLKKVTKAYVCIDNVLWSSSCVIKALDTCFKCIFALDSAYPPQAQHIWEGLQKCIYKIKTAHDHHKTTLDSII